MSKEIRQFSAINALMGGLFDGLFTVGEVKQHGNFGLGCSHALAGEVTICDHTFLEAGSSNGLKVMADQELLPFAQITTFTPDEVIEFTDLTKGNLYSSLAKHVALDNIFLALKIEGKFDQLKIRRPIKQEKPYKSVLEVVKEQIEDNLTHIEGTLIGFWTPQFFEQISVAGFHVHFIDKDRKTGGHVMDFAIQKGTLAYECKHNIQVSLPTQPEYLDKDLNLEDLTNVIKKVEN